MVPGLAAVLVGSDPASAVYVRNKRRACDEAEMFSETFELPEETSQEELIALVRQLNADPRFHGILVQLPLPPHIEEREVILAIDPDKDVDGMHPINGGRPLGGQPTFPPRDSRGCATDARPLRQRPGGEARRHRGTQQYRR